MDAIHYIEQATHWLDRLRVPIIVLLSIYYAIKIGGKVIYGGQETRGLWEDIIKFLGATVCMLLPEAVRALTGYLGR